MSQMQEGEQEQQTEESGNAWVFPVMKGVLIVLGMAILLAIVGVVLGANNFMSGPVHYPAWLLATWLVVDILLLVFLLLHLVLYGVIASWSSSDQLMTVLIILGVAFLLVGGTMLSAKHLAWVSLFELLFLVAATVINVIILMQSREW